MVYLRIDDNVLVKKGNWEYKRGRFVYVIFMSRWEEIEFSL